MTSGKCLVCGKEYKNLESHKRWCKGTPTESIQNAQICDITKDNVKFDVRTPETKNTLKTRVKEWINKRQINKGKRPIFINPPNSDYKYNELTEEQRITNLLKDAPIWTGYRTSALNKFLVESLNHGMSFACCVFVSEHAKPKVLYLPYEPEKNRLIIPDKGYYVPSQRGQPFFFHSDYSLELIHAPVLKDRFNIPAHVRQSDYAMGLKEGVTQAADELIKEIKQYRMICYVLGAIVLMCLFALVFVAYSYNDNYKAIATQMINLTAEVRQINP